MSASPTRPTETEPPRNGYLGEPATLIIEEDKPLRRNVEPLDRASSSRRILDSALLIGAIAAQVSGCWLMWHFRTAPAKAFFWEGVALSTAQLLVGFNKAVNPMTWNVVFGFVNIVMLLAGWHLLNMT